MNLFFFFIIIKFVSYFNEVPTRYKKSISCVCLTEVFSRKDRDKRGKTFFENIAAKHVLNFLIR